MTETDLQVLDSVERQHEIVVAFYTWLATEPVAREAYRQVTPDLDEDQVSQALAAILDWAGLEVSA